MNIANRNGLRMNAKIRLPKNNKQTPGLSRRISIKPVMTKSKVIMLPAKHIIDNSVIVSLLKDYSCKLKLNLSINDLRTFCFPYLITVISVGFC